MRVMKMRLVCECGRNLADVTHGALKSELRKIEVSPRPNVEHRQTEPGLKVPGEPRTLLRPPTHTWWCRCGRKHERRHDRIVQAWNDQAWKNGKPTQGVVRMVLDLHV